ncbi:unnamed protein product, partial [Ectocarpus sp. 8 AP-2014]
AAAAAAAAAAVPAAESPLAAPEPYVPSSAIQSLLHYYYYYWDPLLDRTAHFAMDSGVAPVLLHHIVSVYGAEFASSVATLSTADVDY